MPKRDSDPTRNNRASAPVASASTSATASASITPAIGTIAVAVTGTGRPTFDANGVQKIPPPPPLPAHLVKVCILFHSSSLSHSLTYYLQKKNPTTQIKLAVNTFALRVKFSVCINLSGGMYVLTSVTG